MTDLHALSHPRPSGLVRPRDLVLLCVGVLLLGCSAPKSATPVAATGAAGGNANFSLDTPVSKIAANPQGKAVLVRDCPGLMASPKYDLFDGMSLSQLAILSHGRLSQAKLAQLQTDLAQVPALPEETGP